ncbi:MAG: hypothetical protein K0Q77_2063 [Anaerosporomusa subterranea]|jgi:hypothetical protein|nr:hypothetical protein [Anaerosporomusa subterranea]
MEISTLVVAYITLLYGAARINSVMKSGTARFPWLVPSSFYFEEQNLSTTFVGIYKGANNYAFLFPEALFSSRVLPLSSLQHFDFEVVAFSGFIMVCSQP